MAPQFGLGTFRIDQTGFADAYAMSNGNDTEVWALRIGTFMKPTYPSPSTDLHIEPILPAPPTVNGQAMCDFLPTIGENPAYFEIRVHSITPHSCD